MTDDSKKTGSLPAFTLTEILEGRKNKDAYTMFFKFFLPFTTKRLIGRLATGVLLMIEIFAW